MNRFFIILFIFICLSYPLQAAQENIVREPVLIEIAKFGTYDMLKDEILHHKKPNITGKEQKTALMHVSYRGGADMVGLLVAQGADKRPKDIYGNIALHYAVQSGVLAAVEALQDKATINIANKNGKTPLIFAAELGYIDIAKYLINAGAAIHLSDYTGKTAADWAKQNKHEALLQLLQQNHTH